MEGSAMVKLSAIQSAANTRDLRKLLAVLGDVMLFAENPSQLDDRVFWQQVTDMSETGGVFTSENLVSNEPNCQGILTRLGERVKPGGVYLGVGRNRTSLTSQPCGPVLRSSSTLDARTFSST